MISRSKKPLSCASTARSCDRTANSSISWRGRRPRSRARSRRSGPSRCRRRGSRSAASTSAGRPALRAFVRSCASPNFAFGGPVSAAPYWKRLTVSTPPADEHVALARLDRVRGHADRLQRRRAVAVDGHARRVDAGEDAGDAADVGAGLAGGLPAAPDHVLDEAAGRGRGPWRAPRSMISADRSSGRQSTSDPLLARPIGVRAVATITASDIVVLLRELGRRLTTRPVCGKLAGSVLGVAVTPHVMEDHKSHRAGWLRAAVLGANDGIVSIASLVIGVAAATTTRNPVLTAGVAGLVGGAMSMATGEYISVSSQRDAEEADRAHRGRSDRRRPHGRAARAREDLRAPRRRARPRPARRRTAHGPRRARRAHARRARHHRDRDRPPVPGGRHLGGRVHRRRGAPAARRDDRTDQRSHRS